MAIDPQTISPEVSVQSREALHQFLGSPAPLAEHPADALAAFDASIDAKLGVQPIPTPEAPVSVLQRPGVRRAGRIAVATAGVALLAGALNYGLNHSSIYGDQRNPDPQEQPSDK